MTAANPQFLRAVIDDLAPLGTIEQRSYFGGVALVCDHHQFAFIMGTSLYLATSNDERQSKRSNGAQPFEYTTKLGIRTVEAYYDTPAHVLANPDVFLTWARDALTARSPSSTAPEQNQVRRNVDVTRSGATQ